MPAIMVTGGLGVIGCWVVRKLVDQGKEVVTYDNSPDTKLINDIKDKVECVVGDILDLPKLIYNI